MTFILPAFLFLLVLFNSTSSAQESRASHPLDALTPEEIALATELAASSRDRANTLFPVITLQEPEKEMVRSWKLGTAFPRKAKVVMRERNALGGKTFEAIIDLIAKTAKVEERPNLNPAILDAEWERGRDAFMADPRFLEAIKKRGYKSADDVFCTPNSAGSFPSERLEGRRILKVPCYDKARALHPMIALPVEGITGVVDSETGAVIAVLDTGVVPLPKSLPATPQLEKPLKPVVMSIPDGPNLKLKGNLEAEWARWSFHLRADKRAGIIISRVQFRDGDTRRDIAYQMNVSEMFVPYMDPDPNWSYRSFIDAGEFGLGVLSSPLAPGIDCPEHAAFIDMTMPNERGEAYVIPRMVCLFERVTGDPAFRHYSAGLQQVAGHQQVELVVRHIATVGNYDYVIDYVFTPQGNIALRVGATGFDALKAVRSASMQDGTAAADTAFGALVAPHVVAPYHDHYINFRLDLDIDGTNNTLVTDQFVTEKIQGSNTRQSLWRKHTQISKAEGPADLPHDVGGNWRITNPNAKNNLGQDKSFWLQAHHQAVSILDRDDPPQSRARFSEHNLWVTRHKQDELWAAGDYANVSNSDQGLPQFVRNKEKTVNEDLVLWYTMGFRHATRPEDFPILPTFWHELTLRPAFFFDKDPSSTFNPGKLETSP